MTRLANIFVGFLVLSGCNASGNADVGTVTGGVTGATTGTGTGTTTGATTGATTGTTTGATTGSATGSGCVELLGCGTHVTDDLLVETFVGPGEGLTLPRDLEFHPQQTDELWIVNRTDHSVVIVFDAGLGSQSTQKLVDGENQRHFLAQPSAMAFNQDNGTWASIHEEDDYTQGPPPWGTPQDFMGPTHWTGDSAIFAGDHWTHLDMLHNSPLGMGIAWDNESVFWVFDGYHSSLTRYNFKSDHGLGGTDHSDGVVHRFVEGEVSMVRDVPSHLFVDHATGLVYVADTGNNRIAVLDGTTGTPDGPYGPNYDGGTQTLITGASLTTVVEGSDVGMSLPSGLEWNESLALMFVTDNGTGKIHAFDLDGNEVDWLDTGLGAGALMGLAFDPRDGSMWIVDATAAEVVRISVP